MRSTLAVLIAASLFSTLATACDGRSTLPPTADVLMEADRAFDAAVSEGGSQAWADWFAADGAMIQPSVGEIRGKPAVRAAVGYLDDPSLSLRWEPTRADIAASGDLGWTTGTYRSVTTDSMGVERVSTGHYVSIWRLQPDGSWRVVMDLGSPLTPSRPTG